MCMRKSLTQHVVMQLAFRPFFLMAGFWALFAVGIWLGQLSGWWRGQQLMPASLWHAHEMLFGFGALIAAGFLLTAAQTWTGVSGLKGGTLVLLCVIWLLARLVPFVAFNHGIIILLILQTLWWLCVFAAFGRQLWLAKSRRNYPLAFLLLAMAGLNSAFLSLIGTYPDLAAHLSHSMVLLFTLLMGVIGARVIPFFTARSTHTKQSVAPRLDNVLLVISIFGTALFIVSGFITPLFSPGWLMLAAGALHALRLFFWFTPRLLQHALLWSLHAAYLLMALGLVFMGLSLITGWVNFKDMLHLVAVGAMATMMVAMMARVSLGHTGRPLVVHRLIAGSFTLLLIAGIARAAALLTGIAPVMWQFSSVLWLTAFLIFIWVYWPILTTARLEAPAN